MNTFLLKSSKRIVSPLLLGITLIAFSTVSWAGVLLTKSNQAEVGAITESGNKLSMKTPYGEVEYNKDNLLWYAVESDVDSLYKAAQKARSNGQTQAAIHLYEFSIAKETATNPQAQSELEMLKKTMLDSLASSAAGSLSESSTNISSAVAAAQASGQNSSTNLAAADPNSVVPVAGKKDSKADKKDRAISDNGLKSKINPIVAGIFALVVLAILWQITMDEPDK